MRRRHLFCDDGDDDGKRDCQPSLTKLLLVGATIVVGLGGVSKVVGAIKCGGQGDSPRRAKLLPFTKRHDGIELSAKQAAQVGEGQKVMLAKRDLNAGGGRGTAVCDVASPPKYVWNAVLDFEHYEGRLAQCKKSTVYERKRSRRTETIKVHMILDAFVKEFNCYYDHTYRPDESALTWTLDPDKKSDFNDVQGQWCVDKHPTKPNWSRVWYSADIALPPWLPKFVVVNLCKTSGVKALDFAKQAAEAEFLLKQQQRKGTPGRWGGLPSLPSVLSKR
mmetsp:Transcript_25208/g.81519  ORF Transcript_25208/g.81519 Transcript_25208/m.81519 type:complete len:277 (-) Transcript_25208:1757-2587(-)